MFSGKCKNFKLHFRVLICSDLEIYYCLICCVLFFDFPNLEVKLGLKFLKAINMPVCGRILKEVCKEDVIRAG